MLDLKRVVFWHFDWNKRGNFYGNIGKMEHLLKTINRPRKDEKQGPRQGNKVRRLMLASATYSLKLYLYIYRLINTIYQI